MQKLHQPHKVVIKNKINDLKESKSSKLSNVISLLFLSSEDETSPSSVESDTLQSADLGRFSHFHCIVLFTPYPTY